jgi:hypothetical protein
VILFNVINILALESLVFRDIEGGGLVYFKLLSMLLPEEAEERREKPRT